MAGIARVRITELFWNTLATRRGTPEHRDTLEKLQTLVARKTRDLGPATGKDSPFSSTGPLKGIWHLRVSNDPHVVVFYIQEGDALVLGMVGSHKDYGFKGNNASADARTAKKVRAAQTTPHVPSPEWDAPPWRRPSDLTDHPDLPYLSREALEELLGDLRDELKCAPIFSRVFGHEIGDGPDGAREMDDWLEETMLALEAVSAAIEATPLTGEDWLARAVAEESAPRRR